MLQLQFYGCDATLGISRYYAHRTLLFRFCSLAKSESPRNLSFLRLITLVSARLTLCVELTYSCLQCVVLELGWLDGSGAQPRLNLRADKVRDYFRRSRMTGCLAVNLFHQQMDSFYCYTRVYTCSLNWLYYNACSTSQGNSPPKHG